MSHNVTILFADQMVTYIFTDHYVSLALHLIASFMLLTCLNINFSWGMGKRCTIPHSCNKQDKSNDT